MVLLASFVAIAPEASAQNVAQVSTKLAADTQRLATARTSLAATKRRQVAARRAHRALRGQVEARLVAIYKYGSTTEALATVATGGSMGEVGTSIDTLDIVTRHEARALRRFQRLGAELTKLAAKRAKLEADVKRGEAVVKKGRAALSRAQAAADAARDDAAKMATIRDSPLLPRVGHPENTAIAMATGSSVSNAQPVGFNQSGTASFYADSFSGELTANGERYDPNAFTAAHPSLPFGTWVNVSGPGGSIAVRINDRGPFVGGRVIDLSRAAAAAISLPGIGPVTLTVGA
ncbi:MAG: hypothetical protein JWM25_1930 [Thermoleophilia bacterium]|nr:hypothetical protein [Thermoleophilia bacterium]MCZ4497345.1 hypothetical protein [Thermoleophilia bacterium]